MSANQTIQLLPDHVINQIAAGEVIQRPASVVKELVENAIDAGATQIDVVVKDAGRTLIQVVDNGKGMSPEDAVTAFERHATSKIRTADDLYRLHTMGFRGEALASIVSISYVDLRTRRKEDELGTQLHWIGNQLEANEPVACGAGTSFAVKNLFFNVPARRKFLKSNEAEFRAILNCFQQIALVYPEIAFSLTHNDSPVLQLPVGGRHQRIEAIFGHKTGSQLLNVEVDTQLIKISGYVGLPSLAQKRGANQYFFVNGRYIQHPYFNKAVTMAYEKIIPADQRPAYFLYFDVDPSELDVNIHPTKTEVKFAQEQSIFPILTAAVRETLGKANVAPSIDFDREGALDIPAMPPAMEFVQTPPSGYNPHYNPFSGGSSASSYQSKPATAGWNKLFETPTKGVEEAPTPALDSPTEGHDGYHHWQYKLKYLMEAGEDGLLIIDQHRAHLRIEYERLLRDGEGAPAASQQLLFPEEVELTAAQQSLLSEWSGELQRIGFRWETDGGTLRITATPATLPAGHAQTLLQETLQDPDTPPGMLQTEIRQRLALSMARQTAIRAGQALNETQICDLINRLYQCDDCQYSPEGGKISFRISDAFMENELK